MANAFATPKVYANVGLALDAAQGVDDVDVGVQRGAGHLGLLRVVAEDLGLPLALPVITLQPSNRVASIGGAES